MQKVATIIKSIFQFHSNHLQEVEMKKSSVTFSITSQQLAHLILSVKPYYLFLEQKWGKQAVFLKTENTIQPEVALLNFNEYANEDDDSKHIN